MHPRDLYRVLYRNGPGDRFKRVSDAPFEADSFYNALEVYERQWIGHNDEVDGFDHRGEWQENATEVARLIANGSYS